MLNLYGISAFERAVTAMKCVDSEVKPSDFRRPGHMFPLRAREGGVLVKSRTHRGYSGYCAACGNGRCGLCCEIMRDDGTMMRTHLSCCCLLSVMVLK